MKRPIVILWLLGILALCLPLSYLIIVKQQTYKNEQDFMLLVLICAVVAFLFIGAMCWGVYYFLKKRGNTGAAKTALMIFTGLVVGVSAVSAPEGLKKMKQRAMYLNKGEYRKEFIKGCVEETKRSLLSVLEGETNSPEQKLEDYCSCSYDKMEADLEVSEMMMDESVSNEEFQNHSRVKEIRNECMGELMKAINE